MDTVQIIVIYLLCLGFYFISYETIGEYVKFINDYFPNINSWSFMSSNILSIIFGYHIQKLASKFRPTDEGLLDSEIPTAKRHNERGRTMSMQMSREKASMKLIEEDDEPNVLSKEVQGIIKIIENVPLMPELTRTEVIKLADSLKHEEFEEGETLMVQGETGDKFFIIKEGICSVEVKDQKETKVVATLCKGDYVGEQALITWDAKRTATVRAKFQTKCLTLSREKFMTIFKDSKLKFADRAAKRLAIQAEKIEEVLMDKSKITPKGPETLAWLLTCVSTNMMFQHYNEGQKNVLIEYMKLVDVPKGKVLFEEGDEGHEFYVIDEGKLDVIVNGSKVGIIERGVCFGEFALIYNSPRSATVVAVTAAKVWSLHRITFRKVIKDHNQNESTKTIGFLKKVPLLAQLSTSELQLLNQTLETMQFRSGQVIFKEGDDGDKFYIVKEGNIAGFKEKLGKMEWFKFDSGDYFGERALLKDEPRSATIICETDVTVLMLSRQDFCTILGPLEDIMLRQSMTAWDKVKKAVFAETTYPTLEYFKENTKGVLGRGAYGVVNLVIDQQNQTAYAMKVVSIRQVVENGHQDQILDEKNILKRLRSRFIVNLRSTYRDEWWLYFLLDACLGGDLFELHRKRGSFDELTARFYTACVIEGFEHMHGQCIAYRDLKPENLVLDKDGYLKITDFGLSKCINGTSFSVVGTLDYLSPEIITGQGHDMAVDWWALGVLIFELVASTGPFHDTVLNCTLRKIIQCKFEFPKLFSAEIKDLISRLLVVRPTKRLGMIKGGTTLLKKQAWFKGFDWELLNEGKMEAPIKPNVKSFDDTDNFKPEESQGEKDYKFDPEKVDLEWAKDF